MHTESRAVTFAPPSTRSTPGARTTSSVDTSLGDFFQYHGWLAPGVRLFRHIGFTAKALWISLAFTIPPLVMLNFLASAANS